MKNGSASSSSDTPEVFPSPCIGTRINMPFFATTRNFRKKAVWKHPKEDRQGVNIELEQGQKGIRTQSISDRILIRCRIFTILLVLSLISQSKETRPTIYSGLGANPSALPCA